MSKGQRTTSKGLRLEDETWEWLDNESRKKGKSINEILKGFIEWYIKKLEEKRENTQ